MSQEIIISCGNCSDFQKEESKQKRELIILLLFYIVGKITIVAQEGTVRLGIKRLQGTQPEVIFRPKRNDKEGKAGLAHHV